MAELGRSPSVRESGRSAIAGACRYRLFMMIDPLSSVFSERFADPQTGRTAVILRWDRGWTTVRAELPSGSLPDVTDLSVFEGAGVTVPTSHGELTVRIDRGGHRPRFVVTEGSRTLVSLPEDRLSPQAIAELQAAESQPKGSSSRALLLGVAALFIGFIVVTAAVIGLARWSKDGQASTTFPANSPGFIPPSSLFSSVPPPSAAVAVPGQAADLTAEFLRSRAVDLGAADPDAAVQCMTSLNVINEADVIEMKAPYRSSLYQCLPDELSNSWLVTATGLTPADTPCARRASIVGLGRLSLSELEIVGPTANSTQFPLAIQDKLVQTVRELCPQIPADVAERVIKE